MKNANFKVRAARGLMVPYETKPRKYITDGAEVTVPATAYYLRRLSSGELVDLAIKVLSPDSAQSGVEVAPKSKTAKGA